MYLFRDTILQRAKALRKKQRSGIIAPPTTPLSLQTSNPAIGDTPDVPDFTPLARRSMFRRMTRPALPTPIVDNAPFQDLSVDVESTRLSASLLAPRYSHLLKEAVSISNEHISTIEPASSLSTPPVSALAFKYSSY